VSLSDLGATAPVRTTCLVADDHPAVIDSLTRVLGGAGIEIVATARSGREALAALQAERPQVALLDVRLPDTDGVALTREVKRLSPETAVVLYTASGNSSILSDALAAGVAGVVLKDAPLADIVRAITSAAAGELYVDPALAGVAGAGRPALTDRERQILGMLADGHSNEEVAETLYLSPETVRAHVVKASRKLGAKNRTHAVVEALRLSLIG
jgi:DNA-binding NarL/FixJ family response regulator